MKKSGHIVRYSAEELAKSVARGESETDWARVDATPQAEIELLANEDEGTLHEGWEQSIFLGAPAAKRDIHIRLDAEVLEWFQAGGKGYQTRINAVLRAFVRTRLRADAVQRKLEAAGFSEADANDALDWARKRR